MFKISTVIFSILCVSQFSFAGTQSLSCAFIKPVCQNLEPMTVDGEFLNLHYTTNNFIYVHAQVAQSLSDEKTSTLTVTLQALNPKDATGNSVVASLQPKKVEFKDGEIANIESEDLTVPGSRQTYRVHCVATRSPQMFPRVCQ